MASNNKERARASAQKEERKGHTDIRHYAVLDWRKAALNTSGGPTTHIRAKEAAKVLEIYTCARQRCAGRTEKLENSNENEELSVPKKE